MLTVQNKTRAGKIFKCTIFVGYGGVIFFTGVALSSRSGSTLGRVNSAIYSGILHLLGNS